MQRSIHNPIDGQRRLRPTRLASVHSNLREMFTGTSGPRGEESQPAGHKTLRITIPATGTPLSNRSPPNPVLLSPVSPVSPLFPIILNPSPRSTRPATPETSSRISRSPAVPPQAYHPRPQQFGDVGPIVQEPDASAGVRSTRSRQRHGKRKAKGPLLFPGIKEPALRSKLMCCLGSGCALALILCLYLGIALSGRSLGQEFHITFILVILILTIYFCHSLIRLCMLAMKVNSGYSATRIRSPAGPAHLANPREPIRVVLAHDEEAAGLESEAPQNPPPAYGNWRYTVRADPNLLYWQRNDSHQETSGEDPEHRPSTVNRPPSYMSDHDVSYTTSTTPQTLSSQEHLPLPTHPSEVGRIAWNP
ncbi:MAG: hypothetical protein M1839_008841 [Geoglossum umbratile]|nr:MAG: hypothetical protein M1839_008841 [Geoglossum umbratile]